MQRAEKIRKKSDMINDDSQKSELEKSEDIAKLTKKWKKKSLQSLGRDGLLHR
jgi:AdoMet-dependent rRNA methyltransferase SPB1